MDGLGVWVPNDHDRWLDFIQFEEETAAFLVYSYKEEGEWEIAYHSNDRRPVGYNHEVHKELTVWE